MQPQGRRDRIALAFTYSSRTRSMHPTEWSSILSSAPERLRRDGVSSAGWPRSNGTGTSPTWYDRHGRTAFTSNASLGIGLDRTEVELRQHCLAPSACVPADSDRKNLEPPFDLRNRSADMRQAYAFFARELGRGENG
ncbi:MAG: hypothetical protein JW940_38700 [Polyangiaceae bacterium]|nr:hypothetical protein [Polyangiaceae bacterium]